MSPTRALRFHTLLALLAVSGCQCFLPVAELDAGVTPGDAGRPDAGTVRAFDGGPECTRPADCTGPSWVSAWCGATNPDAGFSCIEQRCVAECFSVPQRTCSARSDCLVCPNEVDLCPLDTCGTDAFSATVSNVECRPGVTPQLRVGEVLSFVPIRGATCEMSVSAESRGFGQVTRGAARHSWFVRELGGWCIGEELPTGAIRSQVACPLCTFVVVGF